MARKKPEEVIKGLEESIKQIQEYLSRRREAEKKDNPGQFEEILLNSVMRANEALALLVERTQAIGSIHKAIWILTAEVSVILAIMLKLLIL